MSSEPSALDFNPSEDPFVVDHGGFYRRWLSMIEDKDELKAAVARVEATTQDKWLPLWLPIARKYEDTGDALEAGGEFAGARKAYLTAKAYYSIARYPGAITPAKAAACADLARAYAKACAHLDPPLEIVEVECDGKAIRSHFRAPKTARPVGAVLVMCGYDMFKEDRGWAGDFALENGLASLVMDAPGTGENPFAWDPGSVRAWMAAIDWLAARPEVDETRIGAFGISRGGYSVMQLAGCYPERIKAVVANAGHPFGYKMSESELQAFVDARNARASFVFGAPGDKTSFETWTVEREKALFKQWALSELGLVEKITMPVLMINGKHDHLAPIGNIHFMFENGPVGGREARIYPDAGHCAFKHYGDWGPASFRWLADKLAR